MRGTSASHVHTERAPKPIHGVIVNGEVGADVPQFRAGDDVFGACDGACAEYARVWQDRLALKPANLTFEEAATVPTSALAASTHFAMWEEWNPRTQ